MPLNRIIDGSCSQYLQTRSILGPIVGTRPHHWLTLLPAAGLAQESVQDQAEPEGDTKLDPGAELLRVQEKTAALHERITALVIALRIPTSNHTCC